MIHYYKTKYRQSLDRNPKRIHKATKQSNKINTTKTTSGKAYTAPKEIQWGGEGHELYINTTQKTQWPY